MAEASVPLYRPIKKKRVFEEVCGQIRARIYSDSLRPGDKLPAERELAQQLGVGRAAVREALRALENAGVIELRKGARGGAFIQQLNSDVVSASMRDMVYLGNVSLDELIEMRILMNEQVIPLVCARATEEDLAALEDNVATSEAVTRLADRLDATRQFYFLLGQASHNQLVMTLLGALTEVVLDFVEKSAPDPNERSMQQLAAERRVLVECLRRRDVGAALDESRKVADFMRRYLEEFSTNTR
ncbi:FadR/GntR family transcriptional regulator [Sphingopyxis sp. LARHCG72]